jgi:glutathione S-transferase
VLTFYHSPQSCSNGILLLLHEVGAAFETRIVDVRAGNQRGAAYLALNPKGKVPALGLDGQAALKAHGRAEVVNGLKVLSEMMAEAPYLLGRFSVADAALFYVLDWTEQDGGYDLPANPQTDQSAPGPRSRSAPLVTVRRAQK